MKLPNFLYNRTEPIDWVIGAISAVVFTPIAFLLCSIIRYSFVHPVTLVWLILFLILWVIGSKWAASNPF